MEQLLETKFLPPVISSETVLRQRLFDQLELGLNKKLSLISACSGCGKSIFLSSFLKVRPMPYIWYNLDIEDRITSCFLSNLIAVISQKILYLDNRKKKIPFPDNIDWKDTLIILFNQILANSLQKILIVLDDFHKVTDAKEFKELIYYFITNSPPNLHLIILSRKPVSIPLTKLRADGKIAIFNNSDFAFNLQELDSFLQSGFHIYLPKKYLEAFLNYTGGWIASLRMLAETIIGKDIYDVNAFISLLKDSTYVMQQYFNDEIFEYLSDDLKVFLLESSIFERFSIPLCRSVMLYPEGFNLGDCISKPSKSLNHIDELINIIVEKDLFITKSTGQVSWYSYIEIFKSFLRHHLSTVYSIEKIQNLHLKTACWLRDNDYWEEAFRHFILAEDYVGAIEIVESTLPIIIASNTAAPLSTNLILIPENIKDNSAALLILEGLTYFVSGQNDLAIRSLLIAKDRALNENNNFLLLLAFDYLLQAYKGLELYEEMRDTALVGISKMTDDYFGFVLMSTYLVNSYIYLNSFKEAKNIWLSIKSSFLFEAKNVLFEKRLSLHCINIFVAFGEFENAVNYASNAIESYKNESKDSIYGLTLASLAMIKHEMGFFEEASTLFEDAVLELKNIEMKYAVNSILNFWAINASFIGNIDRFRSISDMAVIAHCDDKQGAYGFFRSEYYNILSVFKSFHERNDEAFFLEAVEVLKRTQDNNRYLEIYETYCWLAPMYAFLGDVDTAVELLLRVIEVCSNSQAPYGEARARLIIASLYLHLGRFQDSILHIEKSLLISENNKYDFLFLNKERTIALKVLPFCLSKQIQLKYCSELLIKMGSICADSVVNCLMEREREVKKTAIEILIKLRHRSAESDLLKLLKDSDKEICKRAKVGLNKLNLLPPEPLKIYTFGKFKAFVGVRQILESAWNRKTAKSFFKYFIFHSNRDITLEKLEEIFFNDKSVENAKLNIRQSISTLRKALEPGMSSRRESSYIKALDGAYCFVIPEGSYIDFNEFNRLIIEAEAAKKCRDDHRAIFLYNSAVSLYNGDIFEDSHIETWMDSVKAFYLEKYKDAMFELARLYFDNFEFNKSIEVLRKLLLIDSWHEDSYLLKMKCHLANGEKTKAIEVFRKCCSELKDELNINPNKSIVDLYKDIIVSQYSNEK
ncbi:MAG: hypothetical protein HQK91_00140 [Nitrospirae bacterium]|nr:hypothetical protein [Nitrospirota bacterium]MBF0539846.1 hypothetical protein [Nitrospirota bacterium]